MSRALGKNGRDKNNLGTCRTKLETRASFSCKRLILALSCKRSGWRNSGKKNKIIFSHGKSNARGVAIGFCGNFDYDLKKSEIDTDGRFIILEASVKKETYIFINFYNENEEANQLKLIERLEQSLKKNL